MKTTIVTTCLTDEVEQVEKNLESAIAVCGMDAGYELGVNKEGEGYVVGINKAIKKADSQWLCLLNSDSNPLTENWLSTLIEEVEKREKLDVWFAGPSGGCRTRPQSDGRIGDKRRPKLVKHVSGFCMLANSNAGLLDEHFTHYAGEIDWQWASGKNSLWVPGVYVAHEVHKPHPDWWQEDHQKLSKRYGGSQ